MQQQLGQRRLRTLQRRHFARDAIVVTVNSRRRSITLNSQRTVAQPGRPQANTTPIIATKPTGF